MGSVQSETQCRKCKFGFAMEDYYYKTGEVWIFCDRCGYNLSAFMKHDPAYGKKLKRQAEQLIKEGKIDEALELTGNKGWTRSCMVDGVYKTDIPISEWSNEDKIKTIMQSSWDRYHKKDKDGHYVWDVEMSGGCGAYHHQHKKGGGVGGHFRNKWTAKKVIKQMIKHAKQPKHEGETLLYTKKLNGKWYMINAKTGQKAHIPDNINFNLWMNLRHGDFTEYKICEACKGMGGIKTEGTDQDSWNNCETCKGKGLL